MKKYFFMIVAAVAALAFSSCGPNNGASKLEGIAIQPNEITIAEGGSVRLAPTYTPSDYVLGDGEVLLWETSDTLVATVNERGLVSAVYPGECTITASVGDIKAECHVVVKSFLETIQFTQAILWDYDTTYAQGVIDTIESTDGTTFYAKRAMGELWLCSEGFFVNNDGRLDGPDQAAVVTVYAPFFWAPAWLNNSDRGTVFTLGEWAVTDQADLQGKNHVGAPGAINEESYFAHIDSFFVAYVSGDNQKTSKAIQEAGKDFTGANINEWNYNVGEDGEGGYSYSYIPAGIVSEASFSLNGNGSSNFMCGLDYCFLTAKVLDAIDYWWGVNPLSDENDNYIGVEKHLYWSNTLSYSFGEAPAAPAPKYIPMNVPVLKKDVPAVAAQIEEAMANSKLVLRHK